MSNNEVSSILETPEPTPNQFREEALAKINEWYAGDLHTHSEYTNRGEVEGAGQAEQVHTMDRVVEYATKLGREFVVFSEHSSDPGDPKVLTPDHPISQQIVGQSRVVSTLNNDSERAKAFSSVEANLLIDEQGMATVDVPDEVLSELDFSVASIHAINNANKRDPQTLEKLMMAAIQNPYVDEIGHPYRHIEFHLHDWDYFKKYWRDQVTYGATDEAIARAKEIYAQLESIDARKDYATLKKIIGKIPVEGNEENLPEIESLGGAFNELNSEYWAMWNNVFAGMQETGTIFEINLNSFYPNRGFYQQLISLSSQYPELNYSIVFDFHNTRQQRNDIKEKDLNPETQSLFVNSRGQRKARGRELGARKLLDTIALLEKFGVTSDKVVNSSAENFLEHVKKKRLKELRTI